MRSPSRSLSSIPSSFLAPTSYKALSKGGLSTAINRIERHTAPEAVAVLLFSRVDFYLNRSVQKVRQFFPAAPAVKGKPCPTCGKPGPKWQPQRPNFGKPFFVEDVAQVGLHDWDVPPLSTLFGVFRAHRDDRDCFAHQKGRKRPVAGGHGKVVWDDAKMIDAFKTCEELYRHASKQIEKAVKKHA